MEKEKAITILQAVKVGTADAFIRKASIKDALDLAIAALEKQSVDKCCETCKYELLELDAYPCCDCIRAKDHYEPHTEEEA